MPLNSNPTGGAGGDWRRRNRKSSRRMLAGYLPEVKAANITALIWGPTIPSTISPIADYNCFISIPVCRPLSHLSKRDSGFWHPNKCTLNLTCLGIRVNNSVNLQLVVILKTLDSLYLTIKDLNF